MTKKWQTERSERGMVSFLVTLIMMSVIVLVVVGFTQSTNNNREQAIDKALSDRAFYAAESGVNAAIQSMNGKSIYELQDKTVCNDAGIWKRATFGTDTSIENTCLMVRVKLPQLVYSSLSHEGSGKVIPIVSDTQEITLVKLTWDNSGSEGATGCTETVQQANWNCGFAALRVDLLPDNNFKLDQMLQNTFTAFIFPSTAGGGTTYSASPNIHGGNAQQGIKPTAQCNANTCSFIIKGIPAQKKMFMRVLPLYKNVNKLTITTDSSSLVGTQVMIDSTGKSEDVYKRIRVYLPLVPDKKTSVDNAIQTADSLCKQSVTFPGYPFVGCDPSDNANY